MIQPLVAVALVAVSALPPHPLNQVIGGRDGNQKPRRVEQVQQKLLASPAFEMMVQQALAHAQDPRLEKDDVLKDLNFGQRVRIVLAELFSNIEFIEEWQPVNLQDTIMPDREPEPPHMLDRVIGEKARPAAEVVRTLRESREFVQIVRRAAEQSEPLPLGLSGRNYAETVRVTIAEAMRGFDEEQTDGEISPMAEPKTAAEFNKRGDGHFEAGRYDLALADYNRALKLDPNNAEATSNRGWVYYQQGDLDKASAEFDAALKLDPQWPPALWGRGSVRSDQQQYQESIADFTQAIGHTTDANQLAVLYNDRGNSYYAQENYEAALADYTRSAEKNPNDPWPKANRGSALSQLGRDDEALAALDKAISLAPQNAEFWNMAGDIYSRQEKYREAITHYAKAIQHDANTAVYYRNRGAAHRQAGQPAEAIADLQKAVELDPHMDDYWNELGVAQYAARRFDNAVQAFTKGIDLNANDKMYFHNRGDAYQQLGQHEQAVADFTRAIELQDTAEFRALRGRSYQALADADLEKAGVAINSADDHSKAADRVVGNGTESYARLFLEAGDLPGGLEKVQDARNKGPDRSDRVFTEQQGKRAGFVVWLAEQNDAAVWRVVDVRFVFPTAEAARQYMAASWDQLAEGATESKDAPKVGDECRVFGPENEQLKKLVELGLASDLRAYAYVFRKHNVVVKFFVCQGPDRQTPDLQPEKIVPVAQRIVTRIEQSNGDN